MQGERTNIDDEENCFYLAPLEDSLIDRETKAVEDITVLDPACGSGHMLFYAFDVLYQMYLEEGEIPEEYIPREILRNNLYGIDIDSGAAQIAALSLYLKAKDRSPDVTIPQLNIVSADAVLINGDRKQEVLERARSELEEEILEQIWRSFDNIREFGSLVRVEERIDEILEEHREALQASGQAKFTNEGSFATQSAFVSEKGGEESWEQVKERLLEEVSELASEALDRNDSIEEMFASEVGKTVELLDVLVHEYEVVVTNPPYLSSRKMGSELKSFLKDNFSGYRNTYTCFIERCAEMAHTDGFASLVTPEDFMTLYSFRKLRDQIISNYQFIEGMHVSRYGFDQQKDVYTIPFVLRSKSPENFDSSRFYRMTHEQEEYASYQDKIKGINEITASNRKREQHEDVYVVNQNSFRKIDRQPFVYWFGQEILQLFIDYSQLGDLTDVVAGLQTGDDDRFTRCWWEVDRNEIEERYEWYMLSGDDSIYYYSPEKVVDWKGNGEEIIEYEESHPRNVDYYGEPGVTFRRASKRFTARIQPQGYYFSNHAHFINTGSEEVSKELTGYLCSSLVRFILQGLNPGLDFQVGDGKRIPSPGLGDLPDQIGELSEAAIEAQKRKFAYQETKKEFQPDLIVDDYDRIIEQLEMLEADIEVIHGLIDREVFEFFDLSDSAKDRVFEENLENLSEYPHISNAGDISHRPEEIRRRIRTENIDQEEYNQLVSNVTESNGSLREVSEEYDVSPYTVAKIRSLNNSYDADRLEKRAGRVVSYLLGVTFGRWENATIKGQEIIQIDGSNTKSSVISALENVFDNETEMREKLESDLGNSIERWLQDSFFRHYHCKEYRRRGQRNPIYWKLESPNGAFSCFVYYHEIDSNTLPKLRGQYLDPRIEELE
ncbi:MAG: Eco57I restriction-modification methylase domain-containing protein, partial [Halobacteriaceae archaeon]